MFARCRDLHKWSASGLFWVINNLANCPFLLPTVMLWNCSKTLAILVAARQVAASLGLARISCDAAYNAPCSRANSEWLAIRTAQQIEQELSAGADPSKFLRQVVDRDYNMNTGFYPFVFERNSSLCVAHGQDPSLVGTTMESIFIQQNFGFSNGTELHLRFVTAAETGGDWVQYFWKAGDRIVDRVAYVTGVTNQWYIGVGYTNEQLPLDLPCSSEYDSWCSINNVQSIAGKAQNHLAKAVTQEQFETALHDISYDSSRFEAPGGYYAFVTKFSGELMAHPRLQAFLGQHYADIQAQIGTERDEGQQLLDKMVAAAQGANDGWLQYQWQNQTKVSYIVKTTFRGEEYLLGSGFTFQMGQVIPAPLGQQCPGYNLPCAFGTTLQLTSHALTHTISSPLSLNEVFDALTHDPGLKHDDYYAFLYDDADVCVAHGIAPQIVGLHGGAILAQVVGMSSEESEVLLGSFRGTAAKGGGYVFYKWRIPDVPGSEFLKVAYIFPVTLEGRAYWGGVGFNHQRAPLQLELEYGSKLSGEPIPCSSAYGTNCSEVNSQAILGQALSDLVLAASESKAGLVNISSASVEDVLLSITTGDDLYRANDFSVAVFSLDQAKCTAEGTFADNSGCCVAHGGNPAFVGMTWQGILAAQEITSIRGEDLHKQLSGESDIGGGWFEYTLARQGDLGKQMRALSSRFRSQGEDFYVVSEYVAEVTPPTCDLCPDTMECIDRNQSFCQDKKTRPPFYQSTIFIVLCSFVLGLPPVGAIFCWVGRRREKQQAEAQIREIDQQMQMLSSEMEREKMTAAQARKLVSSLFPENVQSQILDQIEEEEHRSTSDKLRNFLSGSKKKLQVNDKPIAELFPEATVIFMDIVGFTGKKIPLITAPCNSYVEPSLSLVEQPGGKIHLALTMEIFLTAA